MAPFSPLPGSSQTRNISTPSKLKAPTRKAQFNFGTQSRFSLLFGQALPQHYSNISQSQSRIPQPTFYPQSHKPFVLRKDEPKPYSHSHAHAHAEKTTALREKCQHSSRSDDSQADPSVQAGSSMFDYDTLSLGVLLCMFISTLWLVATFTSASAFATLLPSAPSALSSPTDFVEASIWGEVGLYELKEKSQTQSQLKSHNGWRRVRAGEVLSHDGDHHEHAMPVVGSSKAMGVLSELGVGVAGGRGKDGHAGHAVRIKRNEAVLEALSQSLSGNKKGQDKDQDKSKGNGKGKTTVNKAKVTGSARGDKVRNDKDGPDSERISNVSVNNKAVLVPVPSQDIAPRFLLDQDPQPSSVNDNKNVSSTLSSLAVEAVPSPTTAILMPTRSLATLPIAEAENHNQDRPRPQQSIEQRQQAEDKMPSMLSSEEDTTTTPAPAGEVAGGHDENKGGSALSDDDGEHAKLVRRHRKHRQKQDQQDIGGL
ncbi:hypothetical protein IAT40_000499 [Kwoniella sp. CBS 6097]